MKKAIYLIHFLFLLVYVSYGQATSQSKIEVSANLSACKTDTVCLTISNLKGAKGEVYTGNVTVEIEIPGDSLLDYVSNSLTSNSVISNINYNQKKLSFEVPLASLFSSTKICFLIKPKCNITDLELSGKIIATVNYPSGYPISQEVISSSNLNFLGISTVQSFYGGIYTNPILSFNSTERVISQLTNNGYGDIVEIYLYILHDNTLTKNGVIIYNEFGVNSDFPNANYPVDFTSTTYDANSVLYRYKLSGAALGPDHIFTPGERLRIDDYFTTPNYCATVTSKRWLEPICESASTCFKSDTLYSTIYVTAGTPNLSATLISSDTFDGCPSKNISFKINNTASTANPILNNAYDLNVKLNFGQGLLKINAISIGGNTLPVTQISPSLGTSANFYSLNLKDKLTVDPDGVGGISDLDNDGFYDDLAAGLETVIDFNYSIECEGACGPNFYYDFTANVDYNDFCRNLPTSTTIPLLKFGFEQVQPIEQKKQVDFGVLTIGQTKTDTAKFAFQFKQHNVNLSNTSAQLVIRYRDKMELHRNSVLLNGISLTNVPAFSGTGVDETGIANPTTDTDSMLIFDLTQAEINTLFDANSDSLQYIQTYYGCFDRQNSNQIDNFSILVQLGSSQCGINSSPCSFDLSCKKPWAYSAGQGCENKPCYIGNVDLFRLNKGYTDITEQTSAVNYETERAYDSDTIQMKYGFHISGDWEVEPNGYYTTKNDAFRDLRLHFAFGYDKPVWWFDRNSILKFLTDSSKIVVYERTPDVNNGTLLGSIGNKILEAPLAISDFSWDAVNAEATEQDKYPIDNFIEYNGATYGPAYFCATNPAVWYLANICPVKDVLYVEYDNKNISNLRAINTSETKLADIYRINIGKSLLKAGFEGNPGNSNYYFEVVLNWKVDDTFPFSNLSSSIVVDGTVDHVGNYEQVDYFNPASTYIYQCNTTESTLQIVASDFKINNPNQVLNNDCGMQANHEIFFESFEGNYFDNGTGEVRVPLKVDSVVLDIPSQFSVGNYTLTYNQNCTNNSFSNIAASSNTGHVVLTNALGGDFPRIDDCSGNKVAFDLSYSVNKIGTAAPNNYRYPVKIYGRDEAGNLTIFTDSVSITEGSPIVNVSPLTSTLKTPFSGLCQDAYFDFLVSNTSNFDAPNLLFFANDAAGLNISNIIVNPESDSTQADTVFVAGGVSARLGTLARGEVLKVRVFAQATNCNGTLNISTDFGCNYPPSFVPGSISINYHAVSTAFEALPPNPVLKVITSDFTLIDACQEKEIEIELQNATQARINNLFVGTKLPQGMQYVAGSAQWKYPLNASNYNNISLVNTIGTDSISFDFSTTAPFNTTCGLVGIDSLTKNSLRLKFKVKLLECPSESQNEVQVSVHAANFCGNTRTKSVYIPIYFTGPAGNTSVFGISESVQIFRICGQAGQTQSVADTIYIKNLGGGSNPQASSGLDSMLVTVPFNSLQMTASNFQILGSFSGTNISTDTFGNVIFKVRVPAGIAVGDSIPLPLSFDLTPAVDKLCKVASNPPFCYVGEFYSLIDLGCSGSSLLCTTKSLIINKGAGLSLRAFECCFGSIGNYAWLDNNYNDIQDASDSPLKLITVYLLDGVGNIIDSTLTDLTGYYSFDSLLAGQYQIKVEPLSGFDFITSNVGNDDALDSDVNALGLSQIVSLAPQLNDVSLNTINTTLDFAVSMPLGSIGQKVWIDANKNGINDNGETLLQGVKVYLLDANQQTIDSTITNGVGEFLFDSLQAGTYFVQVVLPPGYKFTDANAAGSDSADSDVDQLSGISSSVTINPIARGISQVNLTLAAGLIQLPPCPMGVNCMDGAVQKNQ